LILKVFINENKAILNMNISLIEDDNRRIESLGFWLKQIASLNQILSN